MSYRDPGTYGPDSALARAVKDFCVENSDVASSSKDEFLQIPTWQRLAERGTELWLDTGDIDAARKLWCAEFTALTTNNTLLNKEVQKGIYDGLVPGAAGLLRGADSGLSSDHVVLETAFILNAVHALKLVRVFDAKVSVELHTDLAHDIDASVAYGKRYYAICPSHFIVKVPLTPAGLVAARRLSEADIPVNFTLGFSARQNLLIANVAKPSWCNVFMGRINAFLADRGLSDGKNAGERATAASQRVVAELRASGACPTHQIAASMRGPEQVPALAGLDVYTMPTAVAESWLANEGVYGEGVSGAFPVTFADGVDAAGDGLHVFWDVESAEQEAARKLADNVLDLDGAGVATALANAGCGSYFPALTDEENASIAADGKIPDYQRWVGDVRKGRLAWDTLLTAAGLASFSADQAALDDRIRGLI